MMRAIAVFARPVLWGALLVGTIPISARAQSEESLLRNPPTRLDADPVQEKALINDIEEAAEKNPLFKKFAKLLTGAKLTGQFTVDGKPLTELQEESYEIEKVEKLPDGDSWIITARIKYGKRDLTVPVPLEVKWAGTTPVLTLDDLTIPGFGTFSARVVLHKDKYAGTWQHDNVGGHLFGVIGLADTAK
jgi:hypothetical protein